MARRRYYRRSVRVVAAKKKWATNFKRAVLPATGGSTYSILVENSSQGSSPTPVIIKTGNFKVQGDVFVTTSSSVRAISRLEAFILFVPEGWALTDLGSVVSDHPEWIMAWTVVDMPVVQSSSTITEGNKFSMSSRLKRNLNSGDRIVFYYHPFVDAASSSSAVSISCQYWTCAN